MKIEKGSGGANHLVECFFATRTCLEKAGSRPSIRLQVQRHEKANDRHGCFAASILFNWGYEARCIRLQEYRNNGN